MTRISGRTRTLWALVSLGASTLTFAATPSPDHVLGFTEDDVDPFVITPSWSAKGGEAGPEGDCTGGGCGIGPVDSPVNPYGNSGANVGINGSINQDQPDPSIDPIGAITGMGAGDGPAGGSMPLPHHNDPIGPMGGVINTFSADFMLPNSLIDKLAGTLDYIASSIAQELTFPKRVPHLLLPPTYTPDEMRKAVLNALRPHTPLPPEMMDDWFFAEFYYPAIDIYNASYTRQAQILETRTDQSAKDIEQALDAESASAEQTDDKLVLQAVARSAHSARMSRSASYVRAGIRRLQAGSRDIQKVAGDYGYFLPRADPFAREGKPSLARSLRKDKVFVDLRRQYISIHPDTPQGWLARKLAGRLIFAAPEKGYNYALGRQRQRDAAELLAFATGLVPAASHAMDLYEAYSGTDFWTGRPLSDHERALRILSASMLGTVPHIGGLSSLQRLIALVGESEASREASKIARTLAEHDARWLENLDLLRQAASGVDKYEPTMRNGYNFTVARVSRDEMDLLGRAWVGDGATTLYERGKKFYISRDLRYQYRPPSLKPGGIVQGNLEKRLSQEGRWLSNAHFDISHP